MERRSQNRWVLHENGRQIPLDDAYVKDGSTHRRWRRVRGTDGLWYDHVGEDASGRWTYRNSEHDNMHASLT